MTACPVYTNAYLFFDKKKNRELANIRLRLNIYGMIILVEKKGLCKGIAWLPFQKYFWKFTFINCPTNQKYELFGA